MFYFFALFLVPIPLNFFVFALSIDIALKTIAIAIVGRAITIWGTIQKRGDDEPNQNWCKKYKAKRLKIITFAIAKLENDNYYGSFRENTILLSEYRKKNKKLAPI